MSEVANALGIGPTFDFEGVKYHVGPCDFEVEAEMERFLQQKDLQTVRRFAKDLGPAEYQAQLADWRKSCTAGTWSYGSPDFVRFYLTPAGIKKSMFLQLAKYNPGITEDVVDRVWDDLDKFKELDALIEVANAGPLGRGSTANKTTP